MSKINSFTYTSSAQLLPTGAYQRTTKVAAWLYPGVSMADADVLLYRHPRCASLTAIPQGFVRRAVNWCFYLPQRRVEATFVDEEVLP